MSANKRLVVELSTRSDEALTWLTQIQELNKTTVVNRALQVYRLIREAQEDDRAVFMENRAGDLERLVIL